MSLFLFLFMYAVFTVYERMHDMVLTSSSVGLFIFSSVMFFCFLFLSSTVCD